MPIDSSNISVSHRFSPYSPNTLSNKFDLTSRFRKEGICRDVYKEIEATQWITNKVLSRLLVVIGCPDIKKGMLRDSVYEGIRFNDGSFFAKKTCNSCEGSTINKLYDANGNVVPE